MRTVFDPISIIPYNMVLPSACAHFSRIRIPSRSLSASAIARQRDDDLVVVRLAVLEELHRARERRRRRIST